MLWMLAAAGCAGSAVWHVALRLHRAPGLWWLGFLFVAGLFVLWFPAVVRLGRRAPRPPGAGRWLFAAACIAYAFANSWWLPDAPERRFGVMASGHLVAFYALAAAMLWAPRPRPKN